MFDFLFNPQGRISRKGYVLGFLGPFLGLTLIAPMLLGGIGVMIAGLANLFYLWPSLVAVPVRRFHDIGITGKMQFGFLGLQFLAGIMMAQGVLGDGPEPQVQMQTFINDGMRAEDAADPGRYRLGFFLNQAVFLAQIGLFALVPGQTGKNRYGNDPLSSGRGYAD